VNDDGKVTIEEWMKFFNEQAQHTGLKSVEAICAAIERNRTSTGSASERRATHKTAPTHVKAKAPYVRCMPPSLENRVERIFNSIDVGQSGALTHAEVILTPQL